MLTPILIKNIRAFLSRAPLKGEEVPAFNEIMNALAIEEQPPPPPMEEPELLPPE